MSDAQRIATALGGKENGHGWIAHCPAHDDQHASLSIDEKNGKLLVHCHAGCSQENVLKAMQQRGLWNKQKPSREGEYIYRDENRRTRYRVARLSNKKFVQEKWEDGDWLSGADCMKGVKRLP